MASIDKNVLKSLRTLGNEALKEVGEKLGVTIKLGNATYAPDGSSATMKLEINAIREDGKSPAQVQFEKVCAIYGLKPEDFGREVTVNGERFTIAGLNTKAPKNCVNIKRVSDGKGFKCGRFVLDQLK
jgi:hypothetical protein